MLHRNILQVFQYCCPTVWLFVTLSTPCCLYVYPFALLSACRYVCLPAMLSVCPSVLPSVRPSVRPSVCPSVCMYVCRPVRRGGSLGANEPPFKKSTTKCLGSFCKINCPLIIESSVNPLYKLIRLQMRITYLTITIMLWCRYVYLLCRTHIYCRKNRES